MTTFSVHWRRDGAPVEPVVQDDLARGLARLRDDPVARWVRGSLTLCHFAGDGRVSVAEHPAGFVSIVIGRLDAYEDAVTRFGGRGRLGPQPPDAEVVAAAYARHGARFMGELLGDFVAIVWEPGTRTLLAARDRVGTAPLYFWRSREEVVLAGHLGGVMAHRAVSPVPNEGYIAEGLALDIRSRDETIYRDVGRVVAGHQRVFREAGEADCRWALPFSLEPARYRSAAEADEYYRAVLTEAITDRLRGSRVVGAEVSGGLDSSTLAALAAPIVAARDGVDMPAYSAVYPGRSCDERLWIEKVVTALGVPSVLVEPVRPPDGWMAAEIRATRELPNTPNGLAWVEVHREARRRGVDALLSGVGGDQWFDVSSRYPVELALRGRLAEAMTTASRLSPGLPPAALASRHIVRPLAGMGIRAVWPGFRPTPLPTWISPSLARRVDLAERLRRPRSAPRTARAARAGVVTDGWEAGVREVIGRSRACTGVDIALPFYDSRVVQFALGLDEEHRWSGGQFRAIQRRALADRLPREVRFRTSKAEFSDLFVRAFRAVGGRDRLSRLRIAGVVDWVAVDDILSRYDWLEAAVEDGRPPRNIWPLWQVLALDEWCRTLIDA